MPRRRKLPPDPVLKALIRFGFLYTDIAHRFEVEPANVSAMARKLGFPVIPAPVRGALKKGRNGAKPTSRYFG
jgi:hypothetical protein